MPSVLSLLRLYHIGCCSGIMLQDNICYAL